MRQLKRIIVGHDLRPEGETAVRSAAVLAQRYSADIRLVHVIEAQHQHWRLVHPFSTADSSEEIAQKAGLRLQALAERPEFAHTHVEYEVRIGKPFVELIIARRAWQADLIVVGGSSQQSHFLGSTSERVVRKAMVAVLVAKSRLNSEAKRLLVPIDFSDCARKAAEEAIMIARAFSSHIGFFHVVDLYPSYVVPESDDFGITVPLPRPTTAELEIEWQSFLSRLDLEKLDWDKNTQEGEPATAILHQAALEQADLIVMGTHGRTGLEYMLLGSVAEKIVRRADCPVLTIRPDAFQFKLA